MTTMSSRRALVARSVGALMAIWVFIAFYGCSSKSRGTTLDGPGAMVRSSIHSSEMGTPTSKNLNGGFIQHGRPNARLLRHRCRLQFQGSSLQVLRDRFGTLRDSVSGDSPQHVRAAPIGVSVYRIPIVRAGQ